jgi:predicted NAD/FAD-dependent oxidoreductase
MGVTSSRATIAVVGAGMAGASCARALADAGHDVRLLDEGHAVGGRMAQLRTEAGIFDHGAQYLSVRDPRFAARTETWRAADILAPWPGVLSGEGSPVEIGIPAMSAPVGALLGDLPVATGAAVTKLARGEAGWKLELQDGTSHGPFGALVLAVPAPQAAALLGTVDLPQAAPLLVRLGGVTIEPCWTALAAFPAGLDLDRSAWRLAAGPLAWAACNASKPGRGGGECWTLHAGPAWSRERLERAPEEVAPLLLESFAGRLGRDLPEPTFLAAHRWRHALVTRPLGAPCLWEPATRLGLCGDWCLGPRVEAAFLSGLALAETIGG